MFQSDGNLVLYQSDGVAGHPLIPLWASNTAAGETPLRAVLSISMARKLPSAISPHMGRSPYLEPGA